MAASPRIALLMPLYPALTGMRIDRVPDRLAGLRCFGEHVPVVPDTLHGRTRRPVQAYFIFAGAPVPDGECALSATLEIIPQPPLIASWPPAVGQDNLHGAPRLSSEFQITRRGQPSSSAHRRQTWLCYHLLPSAGAGGCIAQRAFGLSDLKLSDRQPPLRRWLDHATRHNAGQYFPAMRVSKRHGLLASPITPRASGWHSFGGCR